jgi:hypothetical protein
VEDKKYIVTMPDGSKWALPVMVIARDRAKNYADEFDGDVERSLAEDTLPLFEEESYEIHDWASNNMNWDEVCDEAEKIEEPEAPDYQEGWVNGHWAVE